VKRERDKESERPTQRHLVKRERERPLVKRDRERETKRERDFVKREI
jgi:hypothetical protein